MYTFWLSKKAMKGITKGKAINVFLEDLHSITQICIKSKD